MNFVQEKAPLEKGSHAGEDQTLQQSPSDMPHSQRRRKGRARSSRSSKTTTPLQKSAQRALFQSPSSQLPPSESPYSHMRCCEQLRETRSRVRTETWQILTAGPSGSKQPHSSSKDCHEEKESVDSRKPRAAASRRRRERERAGEHPSEAEKRERRRARRKGKLKAKRSESKDRDAKSRRQDVKENLQQSPSSHSPEAASKPHPPAWSPPESPALPEGSPPSNGRKVRATRRREVSSIKEVSSDEKSGGKHQSLGKGNPEKIIDSPQRQPLEPHDENRATGFDASKGEGPRLPDSSPTYSHIRCVQGLREHATKSASKSEDGPAAMERSSAGSKGVGIEVVLVAGKLKPIPTVAMQYRDPELEKGKLRCLEVALPLAAKPAGVALKRFVQAHSQAVYDMLIGQCAEFGACNKDQLMRILRSLSLEQAKSVSP
eukprot:g2815.t1